MTNYTIPVNLAVANKIGLEPTLVLQQIKFWIEKCGRAVQGESGIWIYNSYEEWHNQFSYWSLSKLRRILMFLENKNLIISKKVNSKKWNHTKWYSINLEAFNLLFEKSSNSIKTNIYRLNKKKTNRFVQNEQIVLKETKNNYTNKSSYKKKEELLKINKNQKDVSQQMVHVWNDSFECSLKPVRAFVNKYVSIQLNTIFETKFDNDLGAWKQYAKLVNSSKFLMGEKETKSNFKAQFLWLIKEETIDSIQNGAYGIGDRALDSDKIEENLKVCQKEIQQMVQTKMTEMVQEKTSAETEEQEFKKYLINREYTKDGDQYLVGKHMKTIGSEYMYGGYITSSHVFYPGNEKYRQRLFQSYLMKKYYGIDETEMNLSLDKVTNGVDSKSLLLRFKSIREKLKFGVLQNINYNDDFFGSIAKKISNSDILFNQKVRQSRDLLVFRKCFKEIMHDL